MSKEPENMQMNSSTGHLTEPWQSTVSSHNLWKNCLKMCSFDILGSPWMFFGGGWHCTYSCLHRSHNTHWLTAHSPPMLTNTQAWQKILKTHIFGNHRPHSVYISFLCCVFNWSDYYSPLQQLLHATFVNNSQITRIGQNFRLLNSQF